MDEIYKRDCVNYVLLKIGKCPHSNQGYCLDCSEYVSYKDGKLKLQANANSYFNEIIIELGDAIIDESMDVVFKKYRQYPNIQTIRMARMRLRI